MYRCCECGYIFSEPDEWREYVAEAWGRDVYVDLSGCPRCKGGYSEVFEDEEEVEEDD